MFQTPRRSAMKVRDGRIARKNRSKRTPHYSTQEMPSLVIDRKNPRPGYRHLVTKEDLRRFIALLPNWEQISIGLNAIVLDRGDQDCLGWHQPGVIAICAWDRKFVWDHCSPSFISEHEVIFDKLGISYQRIETSTVDFTEASARAFSLIHVLVHELGHLHDRMTTRSRKDSCRGESYAEAYARRYEDEIIAKYQQVFEM